MKAIIYLILILNFSTQLRSQELVLTKEQKLYLESKCPGLKINLENITPEQINLFKSFKDVENFV